MTTYKWARAARWIAGAWIGLTMTSIGCAPKPPVEPAAHIRRPIVANDDVVHAFDTRLETRLIDRLELDYFLRDRDITIEVADGVVNLNGEVWTALEKQRAGDLMRHVTGVIDVANHLDIRPPQ